VRVPSILAFGRRKFKPAPCHVRRWTACRLRLQRKCDPARARRTGARRSLSQGHCREQGRVWCLAYTRPDGKQTRTRRYHRCVCSVRLGSCACYFATGGMYEDVSAVTKVGLDFSTLHRANRVVKSGMEDKSGPLIILAARSCCLTWEISRLTLIPCSINPATHFPLDRLIYFPCSFRVPRQGRSRDGHITGITRTSQKARLALSGISLRIECLLLDATALDIWVLDQLKSLLRNATTNETLDAQLRAPQTVFFLHLLGLDTTGHSYRPHSKVLYVFTTCRAYHASHTKIGIHKQYPRCRRYRSRNGTTVF
jgi:hypothetical protein